MNNENNEVLVEKKKNILPIVLIGVLLMGVVAYFLITKVFNKDDNNPNDNTIEKEKITPLMYEVTKEGSTNKMYLFGSFHIAETNKFDFPKYLMDAYQNSNYVACEFDMVEFMKNMDQEKITQDAMYDDDTTLADHLTKDTYDKVIAFIHENYGYTEDVIKVLRPSQIDSLITNAILKKTGINASSGIDTYFLNKAKDDKKEILEVESYEFQINILNNLSDKYYELAFSKMLENMDDAIKETKELYDAWKKGDEEELTRLAIDTTNDEMTEEEKNIIADYNNKLLDERNIGMTNKFEEYFNDNKVTFYMVGAAHLVGPNGIAKLLEKDGYKVVKVN